MDYSDDGRQRCRLSVASALRRDADVVFVVIVVVVVAASSRHRDTVIVAAPSITIERIALSFPSTGAFHTVHLSLRRLLDRPTVVHRSGAAGRQSVTSRWDGGQLPSTTS